MTLDEQAAAALGQGFEVVQQGRVLTTAADAPRGASFAERVQGFEIGKLGIFEAPEYRSQYDNLLLDDSERWLHLRRSRLASGEQTG